MDKIDQWLSSVDKLLDEKRPSYEKITTLLQQGRELEKTIGKNAYTIKEAVSIMALTDQLDHLQKLLLGEVDLNKIRTIISLLEELPIDGILKIPCKCDFDYSIHIEDDHITIVKK